MSENQPSRRWQRTRRSTLLGIVLLLLFFGVGSYFAFRLLVNGSVPLVPRADRVAILPIEGVIASEEEALERLRDFRDRNDVRAFVLEIRSPGGTVGASQSLYREIRTLREEDERPIIAWIGDVGASGGYYVSLAADSIYALPGSITGSIGAVMQFPDVEELMRSVGVGVEVVKSGDNKDLGSPFRSLTAEERQILEELVGDVYDQFVAAVRENRPLEAEDVTPLADGRVFSGERAVRLGLIDGVATLPEAIDVAGRMSGLGERPRTARPPEERFGLLDLLRGVDEARIRQWLTRLSVPGSIPQLLYRWP